MVRCEWIDAAAGDEGRRDRAVLTVGEDGTGGGGAKLVNV